MEGEYPNATTILLVGNGPRDLRGRLDNLSATHNHERYEVLEDFEPIDDSGDELKIKAGESLQVLKKDMCGWWFAQNENGDSGWVPANFLEEKEIDRNDKNLDAGKLGNTFISLEA